MLFASRYDKLAANDLAFIESRIRYGCGCALVSPCLSDMLSTTTDLAELIDAAPPKPRDPYNSRKTASL